MPKKETYTYAEVVKLVNDAFWDGVAEGGDEYAGDYFTAESYIEESLNPEKNY